MSAITIIPGTQPTGLMDRLRYLFRMESRFGSHDQVAANTSALRPVSGTSGQPVLPDEAPDPLDDLQNATWEDAEWQ